MSDTPPPGDNDPQRPAAPSPIGTVSPDGRFEWDGTSWRSRTVAPAPIPAMSGVLVAPKNPALSLVVSIFLPGVGSMMNENITVGVIILVGYLISFFLMLFLVGFITAPVFWIWGMVDGYQSAVRWNAAHGIVS